MRKPSRVAAVIGLICVAAVVTETGGLGISGTDGDSPVTGASDEIDGASRKSGPASVEHAMAQVPASHAAYGWRYPYVFHWESSHLEHRRSARPLMAGGDGR